METECWREKESDFEISQFDKEDELVIYFFHKPQIQEKWF